MAIGAASWGATTSAAIPKNKTGILPGGVARKKSHDAWEKTPHKKKNPPHQRGGIDLGLAARTSPWGAGVWHGLLAGMGGEKAASLKCSAAPLTGSLQRFQLARASEETEKGQGDLGQKKIHSFEENASSDRNIISAITLLRTDMEKGSQSALGERGGAIGVEKEGFPEHSAERALSEAISLPTKTEQSLRGENRNGKGSLYEKEK